MTTRMLIFTLLFFNLLQLQAQWQVIDADIKEGLMDVHFADSLLGMAVGTSGGVYLSSDGGFHWQAATKPGDESLQMCYRLNNDTLFAGGDFLYRSSNGGVSWTKYDDKYYPREIKFTGINQGILADAAKTWITADGGVSWLEALDQTNTLILEDIILLNDGTPVLFGNIDGGIAYSAFGYIQSEDKNWYVLDVFSFPNSNAFTNAWYFQSDFIYLFANQNERWLPGPVNELWKLSNFRLEPDPFTEEPTWYFDSEVLNGQMPEYVNSSFFADEMNGYVAGDSGSIYKTTDGGINWVVDYEGSQPIKSMVFVNNHHAIAVGSEGTIVVMGTDVSGINQPMTNNKTGLLVEPNPAKFATTIKAGQEINQVAVYNNLGQCVRKMNVTPSTEIKLQVYDLPAGMYVIKTGNGLNYSNSGLLNVVK